jgi:hypothetical protein
MKATIIPNAKMIAFTYPYRAAANSIEHKNKIKIKSCVCMRLRQAENYLLGKMTPINFLKKFRVLCHLVKIHFLNLKIKKKPALLSMLKVGMINPSLRQN